jgi:hypothetical protein
MDATRLHPAEFAYAFDKARAASIVGWDTGAFLPAATDPAPENWLNLGADLLRAAGRLTGTPEAGLNFTEAMSAAILALVDPGFVFLAQRKDGGTLRRMTVHARGADYVGLAQGPDRLFSLTRFAEMTAAAAACAAFAGAAVAPRGTDARVETDPAALSALAARARAGEGGALIPPLEGLGLSRRDAASVQSAISAPAAAGVLSVFYCAGGVARGSENFTVMTNAEGQSWIVFATGGPVSSAVLEASSVGALAARVAVGVAAKLSKAA